MSRKVAREELFKLVFESELMETELTECYETFIKREATKLNDNDSEFIRGYVNGLSKNNIEILEILKRNMTGWNVERIGTVERAILKISCYEIVFERVPIEVSINEAVEIAKRYGDEKSYEFINGVLAKIVVENRR